MSAPRLSWLFAMMAAVGVASCGGGGVDAPPIPSGPSPCGRTARPPKTYRNVVWIVMENMAYPSIIGSTKAPYINLLARRCGSAASFHAESHPSLPNYIAMTSGSTRAIGDDAGPGSHPLRAASIFSLAGPRGWRALEESMPSNCHRSDSGEYAVRHNPATYYLNARAACATNDVPLRGSMPDISARFTFVTPNLCNDMHDCNVQTGDRWLNHFLPKVFASTQYRSGTTAVFLTWDEDDRGHANRIPTLVIAPSVHPGTSVKRAFNHYSLLRTTQELLRLRPLLGEAARARSMRTAFNL